VALKSVLFIVRSFSGTGAQPIRFRQIISHLAGGFDIHVLEMTRGKSGARVEDGVTIHSLGYSLLGGLLNPPAAGIGASRTGYGSFAGPAAVIKRHIRSLFFPDTVITEASRLRREAVRLTLINGFSVVVLSAFPFSVMLCAGALKKKTGTRIILDVGDPFYSNSRNGLLRDALARRFERKNLEHIDSLVVTNEITRRHYLNTYSILRAGEVHVIPMGFGVALASGFKAVEASSPSGGGDERFVLVYAGQFYRKLREPFELYRAVISLQGETDAGIELKVYGSFSREFSSGYEEEESIRFMGQVSHESMGSVYRSAGAVVFIDNAYGMQTPGKVFEVVLTGRPVLFITDRSESPALEVIKGLRHVIISANSAGKIAAAIMKLTVMTPEYPSVEQVSGFLWERRAEEYRKILLHCDGE
jgi:hypothetical protein